MKLQLITLTVVCVTFSIIRSETADNKHDAE